MILEVGKLDVSCRLTAEHNTDSHIQCLYDIES